MTKTKSFIPWAKPEFFGNEIKYVTEALESTWISGGRYLNDLEKKLNAVLQKKHVLAVSNGTTAIHLAYLGLGLKPGDEVIVPGFAFMAAANVALHMNLKPVFAEVDPTTWCLSHENMASLITSKTKAIVPVHTYGNVCEMNLIMKVADELGIPVIEDCAESLFSKYEGKQSGSFGAISTYSFHATKTITTGEGGAVSTDSDEFAERMMLYRSHGMDRSKKFYWHDLPGHNFRLTNFQAAMGVAQMEQSDKILKERKRVYTSYFKNLAGNDSLDLQSFNKNVDPVVWAVAMKLNPRAFSQGRDRVIEQMKEKGIECRPGFYSSNQLKIYEPHSVPVCDGIAKSSISLPSYPSLSDDEISMICSTLISLTR
jgi:perosamine synthetase